MIVHVPLTLFPAYAYRGAPIIFLMPVLSDKIEQSYYLANVLMHKN